MVHSFQIAYLLYKFIKLQDQIRRNAIINTDLSKKDQKSGVFPWVNHWKAGYVSIIFHQYLDLKTDHLTLSVVSRPPGSDVAWKLLRSMADHRFWEALGAQGVQLLHRGSHALPNRRETKTSETMGMKAEKIEV